MLDILRPMAEEKRLTMTASGPRADIRMGHASALNRVLLNLATNAIKFTNTGSVAVTCPVQCEQSECCDRYDTRLGGLS
ncbi:MAG: hypothetical protein ACT4R6_11960 [Gemmatimonadaceae bacterium]